ncbi:hypothetical protein EFP16_03090 [Lactiplantibacillus pentosus]|uniref:hypothetical protein n=1 Tax=Lactiplantibacillus pentosus TaxID=1589 RepID=UPI0021A60990|nr:hypothetical protein [Lactiplantibacillus pentosus]MCT3282538.1 hypothetical protein [Lactiplantibacillus pentosus]
MRGVHKGVRYVYLSAITTVSLCSIVLTQAVMAHADTVDTTGQNSNSIVKSVVEERKANRDVDSKNATEKKRHNGECNRS